MNSTENPQNPSAETDGPGSDRFRYKIAGLRSLSENSLDSCFIFVLLMTVYFFLQWPIMAFDTDLWTHLNGGRYLVEHGNLPQTSFYSFVSPQREIISYSWLFKAFVYTVHRLFGYFGLIVVRTLICTATLTVIFLSFRKRRRGIDTAAFYVLYALLLVDSGEGIRPYNFSFLFIAVFLYVLEYHPQKVYLLPALAVAWINMHGIEYPVMMLIVGGYLAAYFRDRRRQNQGKVQQNYRYLIPMVLCMAAVFISPYGAALLRVPFTDTTYASSYIAELRKFTLGDLFHFQLVGLAPDFQTVSNLLLFSILAAVILQLCRRQMALHHLVIFAGGCFLLTRGARFIHEFALLSLPSLTAVSRQPATEKKPNLSTAVSTAAAVGLLVVSFLYMHTLYGQRPQYPVTRAGLPVGVASFLKHVGARGRILNDPATGGYLSWRMWPDCLVYMDMQVPFLFTDKDFFTGTNAIYNKEACRNFLRRYRPDYLSIPIHSPLNTEPVIGSEGYVPVFFDDVEMLYVHRDRHRAIADEHQLKFINPAAGGRISFQRMSAPARQDFLSEADRLIRIYPESLAVNRLLSLYFVEQKDLRRAVVHAERIIEYFPNHPEGYLRKAAVLKEMQSYNEALKFYRQALVRTEKHRQSELYRAIAQCHIALQQYRKAYSSLKKTGSFFSPSIGYMDLYRLALIAHQSGKTDEARMLVQFAALKQPAEKNNRDPRIDKLIKALEITPQ